MIASHEIGCVWKPGFLKSDYNDNNVLYVSVISIALIIRDFYIILILFIHTVSCKVDSASLAQYNRYVCNDYLSPTSFTEDDYDQARIVVPNICKYSVPTYSSIHSVESIRM